MESRNLFPRSSWGLCQNRIVPIGVAGYPRCNNPEPGPLYDGECWDCRFLFNPTGEAELWASDRYWETIDGLPEPLSRAAVKVVYERMRHMALNTSPGGDRFNDECRAKAKIAAQRLAAYGRKHYPNKDEDTP